MSDLYIMRWPRNLSAVYINGATIRFSKDQSVYYANEVLSPGQVICTWTSISDYLSSGNAPTLPLLKVNKEYELKTKLEADNELPVEIQINFFDDEKVLIQSYRKAGETLVFKVPKGTVSYEIHLVNLKHQWLHFENLSISENNAADRIVGTAFRQHYEWIHVRPIRGSNLNSIRLILSKGPRSILPISLHESIDYEQIFVYTDGRDIDQLIRSLNQTIRYKYDVQITLEAGLGYHSLPSEFVAKLEKSLKQNKKLGGIENDKLDY